MHKIHGTKALVVLVVLLSLMLGACGGNQAKATPTSDPIMIQAVQTLAVATFSANLTQTAAVLPTSTPMPTLTPVPTLNLNTTTTPASTLASGTTTSCYGLVYVKDVTIPDNTAMTEGESFTKTWMAQNTGTCAWESGFQFRHIGGDAMGGVTLTLQQTVNPGAQTELSIPMTAPSGSGTVTGSWRMYDPKSSSFFGDALTVVITLGGATPTPTGTAATDTPTPTP
jgi:hypothetical protein